MHMHEARLCRVFGQVADEGARLRHRPADNRADMRREIQRLATGNGMRAHQALPHRAQLGAVLGAVAADVTPTNSRE
jgi:hypothetical protein